MSCAVSYGINCLIFHDTALFTLSNVVVWLIMDTVPNSVSREE